jgi:hypothetical protein
MLEKSKAVWAGRRDSLPAVLAPRFAGTFCRGGGGTSCAEEGTANVSVLVTPF